MFHNLIFVFPYSSSFTPPLPPLTRPSFGIRWRSWLCLIYQTCIFDILQSFCSNILIWHVNYHFKEINIKVSNLIIEIKRQNNVAKYENDTEKKLHIWQYLQRIGSILKDKHKAQISCFKISKYLMLGSLKVPFATIHKYFT